MEIINKNTQRINEVYSNMNIITNINYELFSKRTIRINLNDTKTKTRLILCDHNIAVNIP